MDEKAEQHIVMLPFLAQGHLIPFLTLAGNLRRRFGFTVTIATTPLNARYLRAAASHHHIHLHELPFTSSDHGLPPDVENTEALPLRHVIKLFHASAALQTPFRALIRGISAADGRPPLFTISDTFTAWANDVAESSGTVNVVFTTGGAYGTAAYFSLWQHLPHRSSDSDEFTLPGFPDTHRFHVSQIHTYLRAADGADPWSKFFQPQIAKSLTSFAWLCNTAAEIEPLGLNILKEYVRRPIWCVGPLIPAAMASPKGPGLDSRTGKKFGVSPEKILRWLSHHPERSVIYISFGSQNTIGPSQMLALAMGLEDSRTPFIWVLRPPAGFDLSGEFKPEWLPAGFEERTASKNQGLLVRDWAPQVEILSHKSTGVFLSHCGWNSTVESLRQGVALIGWPLAAEQGYNCKMLVEEMGVCMELARGVESEVSREEVRRVVGAAAGGGRVAAEMRRRAAEIGEMIRAAVREGDGDGDGDGDGSSWKALDDFVATVSCWREKGSCVSSSMAE